MHIEYVKKHEPIEPPDVDSKKKTLSLIKSGLTVLFYSLFNRLIFFHHLLARALFHRQLQPIIATAIPLSNSVPSGHTLNFHKVDIIE